MDDVRKTKSERRKLAAWKEVAKKNDEEIKTC